MGRDIREVLLTKKGQSMRRNQRTWTKTVALALAGAMLLSAGAYADEPETETEQQTEEVFAEAKAMYLTDTVRVRSEANADSETVAFADRGNALTVLGELAGWYHVRLDDPEAAEEIEAAGSEAGEESDGGQEAQTEAPAKEGFVKGTYLTGDKEEAVQAVARNDAEIQRKEAEAAAAAAAAAEAAASQPSGGGGGNRKSSGKHVVSTQNVDDCDGSGHGTTIITYSDGSTKTRRY